MPMFVYIIFMIFDRKVSVAQLSFVGSKYEINTYRCAVFIFYVLGSIKWATGACTRSSSATLKYGSIHVKIETQSAINVAIVE